MEDDKLHFGQIDSLHREDKEVLFLGVLEE